MKRKPKGTKYRNLYARGGVIYYQRRIGSRRFRRSCGTDDWERAVARRDLFERQQGLSLDAPTERVPTFADFADQYVDEATSMLAATTRSDRSS